VLVSTKAELERPRSRSDQGFLHEFAADSPLEESGFEPLVPPPRKGQALRRADRVC
jgi:hypothetical protein